MHHYSEYLIHHLDYRFQYQHFHLNLHEVLSLPAVSTVNVSAAGNLIDVFVSPVWMILSAIDKSAANVETPALITKPLRLLHQQ